MTIRTFLDANMDSIATAILVILLGLFGVAWLIWGYATIYSLKLYYHLMDIYPDRLASLTWFSLGVRPLKWIRYMYDDVDTHDLTVAGYKRRVRRSTRTALFFLAAGLAFSTLVVVGILTGVLR